LALTRGVTLALAVALMLVRGVRIPRMTASPTAAGVAAKKTSHTPFLPT
jgi:hypothetical protein